MKKLFLSTLLGMTFIIPASVYAVNVSVPQSTAYGQVLIGNAAGGSYTPVATSTLGFQSLSIPISIANGGTGTTTGGVTNGVEYYNGTTLTNNANFLFDGTNATTTGNFSAGNVNVTSSNIPANGIYLSSTNQLGFSSTGVLRFVVDGGSVRSSAVAGWALSLAGSSGTVPSLIPNKADTTTGIGADASGNLSFITAATTKFEVLNNGNVGIGTTSPFAKLSIAGAAGGTTNLFAISTSTAGFATTTTFLIDANGNETLRGSVTWPYLGTPAGSLLAVDPTGKVIATTSPSGGGAVSSVSNSDGTLTISPTTGAVVASLALAHANTWTGLQQFNANASTTQFTSTGATYLATASGNVGIATTSPTRLLTLAFNNINTATSLFDIDQQGTGDAWMNYSIGSGKSYAVGMNNAGLFQIAYNSTSPAGLATNPRLTIDTSGNVGIGTTSPFRPLTVVNSADTSPVAVFVNTSTGGSTGGGGMFGYTSFLPTTSGDRLAYFGAGYTNGSTVNNGAAMVDYATQAWTAGSAQGSAMAFETTPNGSASRSERLRIDQNGNVGIGSTTPGSLLSIGTTAGINFLDNATSTFQKAVKSPCFTVDGTTCLSAGITSIGPAGQLQTGPAITLATTTTAFNGLTSNLTITGSGNTLTYAPTLAGTLGVGGGGTGKTTFTAGQLLYGNSTAALSSVATTTVSCSGIVSCTSFTAIGASPITITGSGTTVTNYFQTATQPATALVAIPVVSGDTVTMTAFGQDTSGACASQTNTLDLNIKLGAWTGTSTLWAPAARWNTVTTGCTLSAPYTFVASTTDTLYVEAANGGGVSSLQIQATKFH